MGDVHGGTTYTDLVRTALERYPERTAFIEGDRELTYRAAADRIGRMTRVLADGGLHKGQGAAVLSTNRADAFLASTAIQALGARYTALHPLGSLEDQAFVCDDAEIHTLIFDPGAFDERAGQIAAASGTIKNVLALGPSTTAPDLIAKADEAPSTVLVSDASESDLASVLYTGGTTGRPKGVMLPHRSYVHLMWQILVEYEFPKEVRYLAAAPITHAAGIYVVPTLLKGGTVVLHKGFDPTAFLDAIGRHRITITFGVPTMVYALLDNGLDKADRSSLETFIYGASPMSPSRLSEAIEIAGPIFVQLYGQTESAAMGTILRREEHDVTRPERLVSCGRPLAGCRIELLDDSGSGVPGGTVGEICLRSRAVMDGYWKQPDQTEEVFRFGWLHTGDMATRDDEGFYTIVDRRKDMIVSGGFNVFPREVEDVLSSHPGVSMAAVVGVPDDKWGEAVKAVVVPKPGASVDASELIALVRERKGPVYAPKSIDFVDAIPLTAVGKADKKVLRARYWAGQERAVH